MRQSASPTFATPPLIDMDLFQGTVKQIGDSDTGLVALDFAEDVECLDRCLRLDAPTILNEHGQGSALVVREFERTS